LYIFFLRQTFRGISRLSEEETGRGTLYSQEKIIGDKRLIVMSKKLEVSETVKHLKAHTQNTSLSRPKEPYVP